PAAAMPMHCPYHGPLGRETRGPETYSSNNLSDELLSRWESLDDLTKTEEPMVPAVTAAVEAPATAQGVETPAAATPAVETPAAVTPAAEAAVVAPSPAVETPVPAAIAAPAAPVAPQPTQVIEAQPVVTEEAPTATVPVVTPADDGWRQFEGGDEATTPVSAEILRRTNDLRRGMIRGVSKSLHGVAGWLESLSGRVESLDDHSAARVVPGAEEVTR
ncbi:MAG TPA: hypothetical protein PLV92_09650, partial [Pirellulaceae bacterium]|nr:hypothetical protein [Pirellulaceae bacterium]